jgi:hypothetical protein
MLWSSAKVESKELTGESEPTQHLTSGQSTETGFRKSQVLLTLHLSLLELARGFEPPTR